MARTARLFAWKLGYNDMAIKKEVGTNSVVRSWQMKPHNYNAQRLMCHYWNGHLT